MLIHCFALFRHSISDSSKIEEHSLWRLCMSAALSYDRICKAQRRGLLLRSWWSAIGHTSRHYAVKLALSSPRSLDNLGYLRDSTCQSGYSTTYCEVQNWLQSRTSQIQRWAHPGPAFWQSEDLAISLVGIWAMEKTYHKELKSKF